MTIFAVAFPSLDAIPHSTVPAQNIKPISKVLLRVVVVDFEAMDYSLFPDHLKPVDDGRAKDGAAAQKGGESRAQGEGGNGKAGKRRSRG
jgi:hypothetical protein